MFLAGMASYALHRPRIAAWDQLPPREARVELKIQRTFAQDDPRKAAGLAIVTKADAPLHELVGQRVYFGLTLRPTEAAPIRSAVISAIGVIVALPRDPPGNTFDGYLANAGINFRLTRGRVLKEQIPPSAYYRFCASQAEGFAGILGKGVEAKEPELVGVFRAMLLGRQHELSDEQLATFRQTGTMHVFSISGLHIAVIAIGLHALLSLLRLPRWVRFAIELGVLWLYVDITGAAPSAIRAFVMVAVVETAIAFRLPRNPLSALATSALIILVFAPLQLFSASFQMSYGIVAALLLLGLPLAESWQRRLALFQDLPKASWGVARHLTDQSWRAILAAAAIGTAASLVSAVTGVLFFNLLTPGALIANLWLIPACSLVLYMGMFSLLFGLAGFVHRHRTGQPCRAGVALVDRNRNQDVGRSAGHVVHCDIQESVDWSRYADRLVIALVAGYTGNWRGWHRGYWAPFAVVAVAFCFGVKFG